MVTFGHVTMMAVTLLHQPYPKPNATRKPHGSLLYRSGVMGDRTLYIAGIGIFDLYCSRDLDLDPMTSYRPTNLTRIPWRYIPDVQTSYVKAFESYRLTDRQTYTTVIPRRFACGQQFNDKN